MIITFSILTASEIISTTLALDSLWTKCLNTRHAKSQCRPWEERKQNIKASLLLRFQLDWFSKCESYVCTKASSHTASHPSSYTDHCGKKKHCSNFKVLIWEKKINWMCKWEQPFMFVCLCMQPLTRSKPFEKHWCQYIIVLETASERKLHQ